MVFDADIPGAFGRRYAEARRAVSGLSFAVAVPHSVCGSTQEAFAAMQRFQRAGGEEQWPKPRRLRTYPAARGRY